MKKTQKSTKALSISELLAVLPCNAHWERTVKNSQLRISRVSWEPLPHLTLDYSDGGFVIIGNFQFEEIQLELAVTAKEKIIQLIIQTLNQNYPAVTWIVVLNRELTQLQSFQLQTHSPLAPTDWLQAYENVFSVIQQFMVKMPEYIETLLDLHSISPTIGDMDRTQRLSHLVEKFLEFRQILHLIGIDLNKTFKHQSAGIPIQIQNLIQKKSEGFFTWALQDDVWPDLVIDLECFVGAKQRVKQRLAAGAKTPWGFSSMYFSQILRRGSPRLIERSIKLYYRDSHCDEMGFQLYVDESPVLGPVMSFIRSALVKYANNQNIPFAEGCLTPGMLQAACELAKKNYDLYVSVLTRGSILGVICEVLGCNVQYLRFNRRWEKRLPVWVNVGSNSQKRTQRANRILVLEHDTQTGITLRAIAPKLMALSPKVVDCAFYADVYGSNRKLVHQIEPYNEAFNLSDFSGSNFYSNLLWLERSLKRLFPEMANS